MSQHDSWLEWWWDVASGSLLQTDKTKHAFGVSNTRTWGRKKEYGIYFCAGVWNPGFDAQSGCLMKRHLPRTRLEIAFTCPTLACCTTSNRHEFCNFAVQAPGLRGAIAWPVSAMGCLVDQTLALGRDVTVSMARLSFWSPKGIPKETHAHTHTHIIHGSFHIFSKSSFFSSKLLGHTQPSQLHP